MELLAQNFVPHGYCYVLDSARAYLSITITLVHFVRKRRDLPFN
jgi:hypothetical protein